MNKRFEELKCQIEDKVNNNLNKLPLTLQNINFMEMNLTVESKRIEISKYNTKSYSINTYFKYVTRFL